MTKNIKLPHFIDVYVGYRIRSRRIFLKMSQKKLGIKLEISFQQVQKYEKGIDRISAGYLKLIAEILDVPVSYFYEDCSNFDISNKKILKPAMLVYSFADFYSSDEILKLIWSFNNIGDIKIRKNIMDLLESLVQMENDKKIKNENEEAEILEQELSKNEINNKFNHE